MSRYPKIALVVPSLAEGGGVPVVARFIKDTILRHGRFELLLVSLSTSSRDPESSRLASPSSWFLGSKIKEGFWDGLPFIHVGAVAGDFEFQRYRTRKTLTNVLSDCDLIQVVCGSPAWANAVIGLGKPVALQVATLVRAERNVRDSNPKTFGAWWRKAMTEITARMDDHALCHVDAIQVENPWMLEYAKQLNVGRVVDLRYAPPGVNAELFHPIESRQPLSDAYILCVARLVDPRKNINLLLEAYALLPEEVRGRVRLVLAGSSGPPEAFWWRADELGLRDRITYVSRPEIAELVTLYQKASVFALPSDEEGLGIVILEAMSCAVPVVSTKSGGPDGIITDTKDGYLVPLDDAKAFSSRLECLLTEEELNVAMGLKARETIEKRYDEKVAGDLFVEMWDKMTNKE